MLDKVKISVASLLVLAGIVAYYQLPQLMGGDVSSPMRWAAVVGAIIVAAIVTMTSSYGRSLVEFAKGSRIELKKMIWPSRQETLRATMMVIVIVIIAALYLWGVDALSFSAIYDWILGVEQ